MIQSGAGASAPASPGTEESPAFRQHEIVTDHSDPTNIVRVRIVSTIRHEQVHTTCVAFHRGAHTKDCLRRSEVWFQYCVTEEVDKGKHDNSRKYRHVAERNLQFLMGVMS